MEFVVFFFLSWLVISVYTVTDKRINIIENTFIFLILLIVSINFSWIINDELKLMTVTQKWLPYTAYLLNRSIIIPLIILIHVNLYIKVETFTKKAMIFISSIFILVMISFISMKLNITEFKRWTFLYETAYYLFLNIVALLSYTFIHKISKNVVKNQ
ncbi:hypothetical protein ACFSCX_24205 [Bacillus salitolerans]|uniref:Histidine kinase N-terminal 7TM region domain-containing protein n=1 Tax=Bacillus salitolerans TaxID=1437434 RepID=A0ABW4LWP5_9BACI